MPLVSATDIPYRGFPEGRTSPQAPSDYQQIPTSPQMFGSIEAEALQKAGQEGEKLATEVGKIGAYQQHYLNLAEQDKLATKLDNEEHLEKYGDPTAGLDANGQPLVPGFKNRYGSDAIDYIKSGAPGAAYKTAVDRIAAEASNESVRQMFLRNAMAKRSAFNNALDEHFTSQLAVHNDQIQKGKSAQADRDATFAWNDDNALVDAMNKGREAVAAGLGNETNPYIINTAFAQSDAARVGMAIDQALANNNPERAKQLLDRYSAGPNPTFTGKLAEHYYSQIQPKLDAQAARRATATVNQGARAAAGAYAEDSAVIAEVDKSIQAAVDASPDKDPAVLADLRSQVRTRLGGSAIEAAIAEENPNRALRLLGAYSDSMDGQKIKAYHDQIKPLLDKQAAAAAAGRTAGVARAPQVEKQIADEATKAGVSPRLALTTASIESNFGNAPDRPGSQYQGMFQLGTKEAESVGGRGIEHGVQFLANTRDALNQRLGREPEDWEVYLGHQQGAAGAAALLNNPNKLAGEVVAPENIRGNGGDPSAPASAFVSKWRTEFERRAAVLAPAPATGTTRALPTPGGTVPPPTPAGAPGAPSGAAPVAPTGGDFPKAPGKPLRAGGDSIALGINRSNNLDAVSVDDVKMPEAAGADAAGSRNPQQALDYIKTHPERFAGQNVMWSTGLFNAGGPDKARAALPKVAEQLDALKAAGANAVVLVGLDKGRFASLNPELAKIAKDKGVEFGGALPTSNVHPSDQGYRDYHAANVKLFPSSDSSPAPAAVRRPKGLRAPGNIGDPVPLVPPNAFATSPPPG